MDYRRLNSVSDVQRFPLPRIDDLVDQLSTAHFFSSLDLKAGYHQMPMRAKDSPLTSFVTPDGQFEWTGKGTPFGLSGAPASFQRLMASVLGNLNWKAALCYLDDVLVWGTTWKQHCDRLQLVLAKFREAGAMLNPDKCKFGVREVDFLGHVIKDGKISMGLSRQQALLNTPRPDTIPLLRRALGAFAFVQRWIPGMSQIAKPLHELVSDCKGKKIVWTPEAIEAFELLKIQVANPPVLHLPNFDKPFVLITDASDVGTGAMLAQRNSDRALAPIAFHHHTLSQSERNYSTTERELLAVVKAIEKFRVYLLSREFELITDHSALRWLNTLDVNDVKGRRGRWIEFLQQFQFQSYHRPGKSPELSMADYLSRVGHGELAASLQCLAKCASESVDWGELIPLLRGRP